MRLARPWSLAAALLLAACGSVQPTTDAGADGADDAADDGGDDPGGPDDGADGADDGADGGGDGGLPAEPALCTGASGSRIRQMVRTHDDGTREVIGLHDAELGLDCRYARDSEGTLRCMPEAPGPLGTIGGKIYTDAACTEQVAVYPAAGATPAAAAFREDRECLATFRYFTLTTQFSLPSESPIFVRNPLGQCIASTTGDGTERFFRTGAEIPPTRFMAGTETVVGAGRIGVRAIDGEDGSRACDLSGVLVDAEMEGGPCDPAEASDGSRRCLPTTDRMALVSTTATCTTSFQASHEPATCVLGRAFTREPTEDVPACTSRFQVRARGPRVDGPVYRDNEVSCTLTTPVDSYFEVGEVTPPDRFAALDGQVAAGTTRLRRVELAADGIRVERPVWFDTELGIQCRFPSGPAPNSRCRPGLTDAPPAFITAFYYNDPECSAPRDLVAVVDEVCGAVDPPRYAVGEEGTFELRDRLTEPRYEKVDGLFCRRAPTTRSFYSLGAAVPDDTFVAGTAAVE